MALHQLTSTLCKKSNTKSKTPFNGKAVSTLLYSTVIADINNTKLLGDFLISLGQLLAPVEGIGLGSLPLFVLFGPKETFP